MQEDFSTDWSRELIGVGYMKDCGCGNESESEKCGHFSHLLEFCLVFAGFQFLVFQNMRCVLYIDIYLYIRTSFY